MKKRYVFDLDASAEFETIEQGRKKLEELVSTARDLGLHIHGGMVGVARETEPIESWRIGSDEPFRNMTSQEGTEQAKRFERALTPA